MSSMKSADALKVIDLILLGLGLAAPLTERIGRLIDKAQSGSVVTLEELDGLLDRLDARSSRIQDA